MSAGAPTQCYLASSDRDRLARPPDVRLLPRCEVRETPIPLTPPAGQPSAALGIDGCGAMGVPSPARAGVPELDSRAVEFDLNSSAVELGNSGAGGTSVREDHRCGRGPSISHVLSQHWWQVGQSHSSSPPAPRGWVTPQRHSMGVPLWM